MAEGFARALPGEPFECYSAGIERHGMNPYAVRVMAEVGVDISEHTSTTLDDLGRPHLDYVVTVCDHAHETCPLFPGRATVHHRGFDDPPRLAKELTEDEEILDCYRRVRDEIRQYVEALPAELLD